MMIDEALEERPSLSFGESYSCPGLHRTAITLKNIVPKATERYRKIGKRIRFAGRFGIVTAVAIPNIGLRKVRTLRQNDGVGPPSWYFCRSLLPSGSSRRPILALGQLDHNREAVGEFLLVRYKDNAP